MSMASATNTAPAPADAAAPPPAAAPKEDPTAGIQAALALIDQKVRTSGYPGPAGGGLAYILTQLAQSSAGVTVGPFTGADPNPPAAGAKVSAMTGAGSELSHKVDQLEKEVDELATNYDARLAEIEKEIGLDHATKAKKK